MEVLIKEGKDKVFGVFPPSATTIHSCPKKKQYFFPPNVKNRPNTLILTSHFGAQFCTALISQVQLITHLIVSRKIRINSQKKKKSLGYML